MAGTVYGKIHLFFGGGKWGWDEAYYWRSGATGSLGDLLDDATGLVGARRKILSSEFSVEAARVSITNETGETFFQKQNLIAYEVAKGGPGALTAQCNNPWLAFMEHASTAQATYQRNIILRGIPSDLLCMNEAYAVPFVMPEKLRAVLEPWNTYLITPHAGTLQMRVKDVINGRGKAVGVSDITVLANGHWQIETGTPVQIWTGTTLRSAELGDTIHVYGPRAPWSGGLSGDHTIIAGFDPDNPTIYPLSGRQQRKCDVDYIADAVACGVNYILAPIERVDPSRPVNKTTGGPFFGTRGRRRKAGCK